MTTALSLEDARRLGEEMRARHQECTGAMHSLDAFLDQAVASMHRGQPTLGLAEEGEGLLNLYESAARRLFESVGLAINEVEASTSVVESVNASLEPIINSMGMLVSRAKQAKAAGDDGGIKAARLKNLPNATCNVHSNEPPSSG